MKTGLTERQVRTALNHLISTNEVTCKTTPKYTVLIVNKYDQYQGTDQVSDQQTTSYRPATDQLPTSYRPQLNKETNKQRNKVTINPPYPPYDSPAEYAPADEIGAGVEGYTTNPDLRKSLLEFLDMRLSKGIATPPNVLAMLFDELNANGKDDQTKIQVVRQSITNGWKGFFPLSVSRDPEPKSVPDWYGDTGENNEMDPALLEKALRIQRELQEENEETWKNSNEMQGGIPF